MGGDNVWVGLQVGTSKKAKWIRKIARYPMHPHAIWGLPYVQTIVWVINQ